MNTGALQGSRITQDKKHLPVGAKRGRTGTL